MDQQAVIRRLNREKASLRALGIKRLSLFGSTARGDASPASDIDLAVTLDEEARIDLFRFAALSEQVSRILGARADLIVEPARNPRMQAEIDRDRVRVY
jgi:predicted nucleotidyltransferase